MKKFEDRLYNKCIFNCADLSNENILSKEENCLK